MNSIVGFIYSHSNQAGFCDNCNEPSGSIKCCDFLVAELVFREQICCVELVSCAYDQSKTAFVYFLFPCYLI
jgi:hypothetical protein